jgi:hypothetical protein
MKVNEGNSSDKRSYYKDQVPENCLDQISSADVDAL